MRDAASNREAAVGSARRAFDIHIERAQSLDRCAALVQPVRSEIEVKAGPDIGLCAAAELRGIVKQHRTDPRTSELHGRSQTCKAATHDDDEISGKTHDVLEA